MFSSTCPRAACLSGLLAVLASVPLWPIHAADVEEDVDLTLVEGGQAEFTNSIGMKFVRVRAGKFKMGAPNNEAAGNQDEKPQHEVTLTKDYYVRVHEVTQGQYVRLMGKNPSPFCKTGNKAAAVNGVKTDDLPVDSVSWDEAQEFVKKLNARAQERQFGVTYRLPTEAEWEYACRGGHHVKELREKADLPFHFKKSADTLAADKANSSLATLNRPSVVGKYEANPLGVYDMHGNLWEWVQDVYDRNAYQAKNRKDPKGPNAGQDHVIRGGSYGNPAGDCRAAKRYGYGGANRSEHVGFRVACVPRS